MSELKPCPFCGSEMRAVPLVGAQTSWGMECVTSTCPGHHINQTWFTLADAVSAINRRAQPANEPLTLDELRGMAGEPIWVVTLEDGENNPPFWEIITGHSKIGIYMIRSTNLDGLDDFGAFELYGKTWLAYRRKPEGEAK